MLDILVLVHYVQDPTSAVVWPEAFGYIMSGVLAVALLVRSVAWHQVGMENVDAAAQYVLMVLVVL